MIDHKAFLATALLAVAMLLATLTACNDINIGEDSDWYEWSEDQNATQAPDDDSADDDDSAAAGCDVTDAPTWTNFGDCFMQAYCTRCHASGGSAPFPLTTYADAQAHAAGVKSETVSGGMPPSAPLPSDAEITQLADWIDAGLPQ